MSHSTIPLALAFSIGVLSLTAFGQTRTEEVTFIKDARQMPDLDRQAELRGQGPWRQFKSNHPRWSVEFNELTGMPRRAYGAPVTVPGGSADAKALAFLTSQLNGFQLPLGELENRSVAMGKKVTYVHFVQVHEGLEVMGAKAMVKLDAMGRVNAFGADLHRNIQLDLQPTLTVDAAGTIASNDLTNIVEIEGIALRILPIPTDRGVVMHLVHEVLVKTLRGDLSGRYRCLVDAHSGELHYRTNEVLSCDHGDVQDAGADVHVSAMAYTGSPLAPTAVQNLPDLDVTVGGTLFRTDVDGSITSGVPGPVAAQYRMSGRYAEIVTNGATPTFTGTLNEGMNSVSFDNNSNVRERSAYIYVNQIHAHAKAVLPDFTGMDFPLPTRLDLTTGDCNANWDGTGINFFLEGNNCRSLATINDVVYHEYGHGINSRYYQSLSSNFMNGAMGEGYSDVWGLSLTESPILGLGINLDNNNSTVRRYDGAPKVYPVDLVGQVHADGEIIAGAWWDTYQQLGNNMPLMLDLFAAAYPGLQAATFNGNEGVAFRDVLLDVLQADDDDGDITNGTPNGGAIVEAFGIHGITLISDAEIFHEDLRSATEIDPIVINADVLINFPATEYLAGAALYYKVNSAADWTSTPLNNMGGGAYVGQIPPQPNGTVVAYYMALTDIFGQVSSVTPVAANRADPGLPYYILVGYALEATENADNLSELGAWLEGLPNDNATTGRWEFGAPTGSYSDVNDPTTVVQPGSQHTEGGELCWFTGNATLFNSPLGENDVDGGTTTLVSANIDLSGYADPSMSYWRWYTNNPPSGANPNADWWQVYASGNNGATWVPVEDTKTGHREWRRKVFRVQDVLGNATSIKLKFHASDSIRPGVELNGGSLVEAALDDIELWSAMAPNAISDADVVRIGAVWPSPARDVVNVSVHTTATSDIRLEVLDLMGRTVILPARSARTDVQQVDVRSLAEGQYVMRLVWDNGSTQRRFTVVH